jgi:Acetyltransferase (GNAT) domain
MALVERPIDPAEIDRVLTFFRGYKRPQHILGQDRDFLLWQFSPERCRGFEQAGLSAIALWDDDEIVGFLGVIGCRFNWNGAICDGGWLCNLIVLPQYRAVGGWMRLMKSVHRLPIGVAGVVGFPPKIGQLYRAMGYHVRERLFRFVRIVDPQQTEQIVAGDGWRAELRPSSASQIMPDLRIETATSLDQRWDRFWQRFSERGYFGAHRDSSYMAWRYFGHPRMRHVVKLAAAPDGEICASAVYRVEQVKDHPVRLMRLLELMALDDPAYESIIGAVVRDAEELGVAFIDHYTTRPLHSVFQSAGWFEEEDVQDAVLPGLFQPLVRGRRNLNVGIRVLGPLAQNGADLTRDLYVVKSDGDQDRPS